MSDKKLITGDLLTFTFRVFTLQGALGRRAATKHHHHLADALGFGCTTHMERSGVLPPHNAAPDATTATPAGRHDGIV